MDLLEHEMFISAFFRRLCIPFDLNDFFLNLFPVDIIEMNFIFRQFGNLHIIDIIYVPCLVQDSRHI